MRTALLALAACSSSPDTFDCTDGIRGSAIHGSCTIGIDDRGGCPTIAQVLCGIPKDCPTDFPLSCKVAPDNSWYACTYGVSNCTGSGSDATYDAIEIRNGEHGLAVVGADGRCTFEACR